MQSGRAPVLAIFTSDRGPGDPERASIMTQAGTYFAKNGASIFSLAEDGVIAVPLITSARAAGGEVRVIQDMETNMPPALDGIPCEVIPDRPQRIARMVQGSDMIIGLPGSLASAASLHAAWAAARASGAHRPVVLLNRNRAFEVLRGFTADVVSHKVRHYDRLVQFTDSVEDMWSRISRLIGAQAH